MGIRKLIAAISNDYGSSHDGPPTPAPNSSGRQDWPHRPSDSIHDVTQEAIAVCLLSAQPDGQIGGIGHWQVANAYTAIAHHDLWSQGSLTTPSSLQNIPRIVQQVKQVLSHHKHCINEFNDDTLWWAHLLSLLSYATQDNSYVEHAAAIRGHISRYILRRGTVDAKGKDVSGAVLWKSTSDCKEVNSITTALWAEFAALLTQRSLSSIASDAAALQAKGLLASALDGVDFIFNRLYDTSSGVILDTLKLDTGEIVPWAFSYTTGATIAACVATHSAALALPDERDDLLQRAEAHLARAMALARTALSRAEWVDGPGDRAPGVLTERGAYGPDRHKASDNDDAVGFKSVLVRSLAKLHAHLSSLVAGPGARSRVLEASGRWGEAEQLQRGIGALVRATYASLRNNASNGIGQYGPWWAGPMDMPTSHSQMAVLDVMAAMRLLENPDKT